MRRLVVLPPILVACAAMTPPLADEPVVADCGAAKAQFAVGRPATPALVETVRKASGAAVVRRLRPTDIVAMNYAGARLNLVLDARGKVKKVRCG